MSSEDFEFQANFLSMKAALVYKKSPVKIFNLNKGDVGQLVDTFQWTHENGKKIRHHIVADFTTSTTGELKNPIVQIYPIAGDYIVTTQKIPARVKGTYQDYLNNHKNHDSSDE